MSPKKADFPLLENKHNLKLPWDLIAAHEAQARTNHGGQSLERLAARGGLSYAEALAVIEDRPWRTMPENTAYWLLRIKIEEYNATLAGKIVDAVFKPL